MKSTSTLRRLTRRPEVLSGLRCPTLRVGFCVLVRCSEVYSKLWATRLCVASSRLGCNNVHVPVFAPGRFVIPSESLNRHKTDLRQYRS